MPRNQSKIAPAAPSQMFSSHEAAVEENGQPTESWFRRPHTKRAVVHLFLLEAAAATVLLAAIFAPLEQLACYANDEVFLFNVRIVTGAMAISALCLSIPVILALRFYQKRLLRIFILFNIVLYVAMVVLLIFFFYLVGGQLFHDQSTKGTLYGPLALIGLLIAALTAAHGALTMIKVLMSSPQRESATSYQTN